MKYIINLLNIYLLLLSFFAIYVFAKYYYVGTDSGYYLALARDFYDGKKYFIELKTIYTPLSIVIMGVPYLFNSNPEYIYPQLINILFTGLSSFLFYKIISTFSSYKTLNLTFSLLLFLILMTIGGADVMLESISLFFQLFSLLLYLEYKKSKSTRLILFSGIMLSLSFLSKQYGLFLLIPIMVDFLVSRVQIKYISRFILGLLLPVLLFSIYLIINGATIHETLLYLLGKGVYLDSGMGTGTNSNFFETLQQLKYLIIIISFLVIVLVKSFLQKQTSIKRNLLYLLSFICSLSVLIFAQYDHYFIYITPYLLLSIASITLYPNSKFYTLATLFVVFSCSYFLSKKIYYSMEKRDDMQKKEWAVANMLLKEIPRDSNVYSYGLSSSYYYLCNYKTTDYNKISYTFYNHFYPETILKSLDQPNEYIIAMNKGIKSRIKQSLLHNYNVKKVQSGANEIYIISKK